MKPLAEAEGFGPGAQLLQNLGNPGSAGHRTAVLPVLERGLEAGAGRGGVIAVGQFRQLLCAEFTGLEWIQPLRGIPQFQQPQFQQSRDRQQFRRVGDQITDAQFQAVEVVGPSRSVGADGGPEMAFVAHLAIGQALLHPLRVVGVIQK